MQIYLPGPVIQDEFGRRVEPFPANLRLNCRGIVSGAYCWDENGNIKDNPGQYMQGYGLVKDLGYCGVAWFDVPEEHWNRAMSIMRLHPLEIPQGKSIEECLDEVQKSAEGLRSYIQSEHRLSFSHDNMTMQDQVFNHLKNQGRSKARSFYLDHISEQTTEYPSWLFPMDKTGIYKPNIRKAKRYLNDQDEVSDWLHLISQCNKVIEGF